MSELPGRAPATSLTGVRSGAQRTTSAVPEEAARPSGSGGHPGRRWTGLIPALVAVLALVVSVVLLSGSLRGARAGTATVTVGALSAPTAPAAAPAVAATRLVNGRGGYAVPVPKGMRATKAGPTTRIVARDHGLVVTIAPTRRVDPALGNARVLAAMESRYRSVRTVEHQLVPVDGRRAVTSYGTALTRAGQTVRFVLVSVLGPRSTYSISAFAAADADPQQVLPRVRAIVNGFRVG